MSFDPAERMTNADELSEMLIAKLRRIVKSQGYRTDIGKTVFEGRRDVPEESIPCTIMVESDDRPLDDETKSQGMPTKVKVSSHYIFEGLAFAADINKPNVTARAMVKDLKRAIFATDDVLRRKISAMRYAGRGISVRQDGTTIVSAYIEIDIDFVEDMQAP